MNICIWMGIDCNLSVWRLVNETMISILIPKRSYTRMNYPRYLDMCSGKIFLID